MNYDGKAIVVNTNFDLFYSGGDTATVIDVSPEYNKDDFFILNNHVDRKVDFLHNAYAINIKFIANNNNNFKYSSLSNVTFDSIIGLVPYSVQVYNSDELVYNSSEHKYLDKNNSLVKKIKNYNNNFDNVFVKVKVSDKILKTNIFVKETKAYVIDYTQSYKSNVSFAPVYMNIADKMEFFVPILSDNFQNMSVIVQKDTFIELKFDSTILNVIGLPEGLQFTLGVIKGTITKSGSYDITIQYEKGSQKLNIIVPYYQRLL